MAQRGNEQTKRGDFGGGIHPNQVGAVVRGGNQMIELRGRGNGGVERAQQRNQDGIGRDIDGLQQRGQEHVLIRAIAVLILENFGSGVGLIASESEGKTNVADIFSDITVERLHFVEAGSASDGQFPGFGADFGSGSGATFGESRIPLRDFVPISESSELDVRNFGRRKFSGGGVVIRNSEIFMFPAIDGAPILGFRRKRAVLLIDLRGAGRGETGFANFFSGNIRKIRGLNQDGAALRDIHFELFIEHDGAIEEILLEPKLTGSFRGDEVRGDFVFDGIAGMQRGNRDVNFFVVGVGGRVAFDGCDHFFYGVGLSGDCGAVGMEHADKVNVDLFAGGVIAED